MTGTTFDWKNVANWAKKRMLEQAILVISDKAFVNEEVFLTKEGGDLLRGISSLTGAAGRDRAIRHAKLRDSILEGKTKTEKAFKYWYLLPTLLGIFALNKSMGTQIKMSLIQASIKNMKAKPFSELEIDAFSFAMLANYTGVVSAVNCFLPGVLLDRAIPVKERRRMATDAGIEFCCPTTNDDNYGTHSWCCTGGRC